MTLDAALIDLGWGEDNDRDPTCGKCVSGIDPWHTHPGWRWVAGVPGRGLRFVISRELDGHFVLEQQRIRPAGDAVELLGRLHAGRFPTLRDAQIAAARRANRPPFSGDIDVGGEPYDVDDEGRGLVHVPCGEWLNGGEDTLIAHQCWWDRREFASFLGWLERNADPSDVADARIRPWRWNAEAREAGKVTRE